MDEHAFLAERFEAHRSHLKAVAHRMLGSLSEAEDAVQEAWLRLSRSDISDIENLGGWLTTVVGRVGRVCLDMLRARTARREDPLGAHLPDPLVSHADGIDPEHEVLVADAVGLALLVVLESLAPAERLAFVLHDMFAVPFEEIAPIVGRSPAAARQLASRARRRVQAATPIWPASARSSTPSWPPRGGDVDALLAVLAPDVVLRADRGAVPAGGLRQVHGAAAVARQALTFARFAYSAQPAVVNGAAGVVTTVDGQPVSVVSFTITHGQIVAIDIFAGTDRLRHLDPSVLNN
jgi:RNA polymerase sigma factor (sigma-70 family)